MRICHPQEGLDHFSTIEPLALGVVEFIIIYWSHNHILMKCTKFEMVALYFIYWIHHGVVVVIERHYLLTWNDFWTSPNKLSKSLCLYDCRNWNLNVNHCMMGWNPLNYYPRVWYTLFILWKAKSCHLDRCNLLPGGDKLAGEWVRREGRKPGVFMNPQVFPQSKRRLQFW